MIRKMAAVLENRLEELSVLTQMLQVFLRPYQLSSKMLYAVELSLEEIFVNIVSYAYEDGQRQAIHFDVDIEDDIIAMKFRDQGRPFNPLALKPKADNPDMERAIGGLGITFVRQMRDMMEYRREDDWNILRIWFQRKPETETKPGNSSLQGDNGEKSA